MTRQIMVAGATNIAEEASEVCEAAEIRPEAHYRSELLDVAFAALTALMATGTVDQLTDAVDAYLTKREQRGRSTDDPICDTLTDFVVHVAQHTDEAAAAVPQLASPQEAAIRVLMSRSKRDRGIRAHMLLTRDTLG